MPKNIWRPQLLSSHQRYKVKQTWKHSPLLRLFIYLLIAFLIGFAVGKYAIEPEVIIEQVIVEAEPVIIEKEVSSLWKITASNPKIIGGYGNNIRWDGQNVKEVPGKITVNLDPENDIGKITAEFTGVINPEENTILDGVIKIEFKNFNEEKDYMDGGIAQDLKMFGDKVDEETILPETHAFVAAFGTASLYLNKQEIYKDLKAIFAYSEGNRNEDNTVSNPEGKIFSLVTNDLGFIDPDDREIHLIVYENFEDTYNFPSKSAFVYLIFENPEVESTPDLT